MVLSALMTLEYLLISQNVQPKSISPFQPAKMSCNLTVKVHPVVYMTMVDAYERRINRKVSNDRALGTLLGFYEKDAVQVRRCTSFLPIRSVFADYKLLFDPVSRNCRYSRAR